MNEEKATIFLSYASSDEGRVGKLYKDLVNAGFNPWMSSKDIFPGESWERSIKVAI